MRFILCEQSCITRSTFHSKETQVCFVAYMQTKLDKLCCAYANAKMCKLRSIVWCIQIWYDWIKVGMSVMDLMCCISFTKMSSYCSQLFFLQTANIKLITSINFKCDVQCVIGSDCYQQTYYNRAYSSWLMHEY